MESSPGILNLYIVRHGQTDYNLNGMFQGSSDIPLNKNGIVQARAIASMLRNIIFTTAYHSPLNRARVTCEIIIDGRLDPITDERLRELNFGLWEGVHRDEIERRWPDKFRHYYDDIGSFHPPEGELLDDARDRACDFYDEITGKFEEGKILIVGHQFINALLCTCIMGQDKHDAWDYRCQPGEVLLFELDGETISFRRLMA